jgi:hypothetical protein
MKYLPVYIILLLTGCCSCPKPQGQTYYLADSAWTVVNNSGYPLDVFRNGKPLGKLEVGQILPIPIGLFQPEIAVIVIGHTETGQYVGTASHRFYTPDTDVWTVMQLCTPQPPR